MAFPRSTEVAFTSAPLIGAPLGSLTVPIIDAVTSWPQAAAVSPSNAARTRRKAPLHSVLFITEPPTRFELPVSPQSTIKNGDMLYSTTHWTVKRKILKCSGSATALHPARQCIAVGGGARQHRPGKAVMKNGTDLPKSPYYFLD